MKKAKTSFFLAVGALAALLAGCLNDSPSVEGEATLVVRTTVPDAARTSGLSKASAIKLSKLIITLTSSNSDDSVRRDTVLADTGTGPNAFVSNASADQTFSRNFAVKALRSWTIEVKTLDVNDSLIHSASVVAEGMKLAETRPVDMNLASRFVTYEARYTLPAELYPTGVPENQRIYQKVFFSRLVLSVDGLVVKDSNTFALQDDGPRYISSGTYVRGVTTQVFFKPNGPAPDTITHTQSYDYVRTGARVFQISAYGYLEGDTLGIAPRLLFQGSRSVTIAPDGTMPVAPITLQWKGLAGSDSVTAGHPDWTGIGLQVVIGRTKTVVQQIDLPGGVDF